MYSLCQGTANRTALPLAAKGRPSPGEGHKTDTKVATDHRKAAAALENKSRATAGRFSAPAATAHRVAERREGCGWLSFHGGRTSNRGGLFHLASAHVLVVQAHGVAGPVGDSPASAHFVHCERT